jgi:hypothetical protein
MDQCRGRDDHLARNVTLDFACSPAAADEVGHLLLGAHAHTSRGLMKVHWVRADYIAMNQDQLQFMAEQAQMLANSYRRPIGAWNANSGAEGLVANPQTGRLRTGGCAWS